jgi:hypothetical protein
MPPDARAWTVLVPRAQGYGFSPGVLAGLWTHLTAWQSHIGALLAAACVTIVLVWQRRGLPSLLTDAAPLGAVLVISVSDYFREAGAGSTLTLIGLFAAPYYAALAGFLVTWTIESPRRIATGVACAVVVVAVAFTVYAPPHQVADAKMIGQLRRANTVAADLCGKHQTILVTVFPEMFFDCPQAQYALYVSFGQLAGAYPRFYTGQTVLDRHPSTDYVVSIDFYGMPLPRADWLTGYHLIRKIPAPFGYTSTFYNPTDMLVYARDPQTAHQRPLPPTRTRTTEHRVRARSLPRGPSHSRPFRSSRWFGSTILRA